MRKTTVISFGTVLPLLLVGVSSVYASANNYDSQPASHLTFGTHSAQDLGISVPPVPPPGFNPFTATNEELKQYGFPARPTNQEDLQAWENAMVHAKYFNQDLTFTSSDETADIQDYSSNWSGKVDINDSTKDFSDVHATWVVPSVSGTSSDNAEDVQWIGFGGYYSYSNGLLQCGLDQKQNSSGGFTNQLWLEIWPYETMQYINGAYVNSGDTLYVDMTYSKGVFNGYLEDETTGRVWRFSDSQPYVSIYYDGSTAEWIVERPSYSYGYNPLADFGSVTFTSAGTNSASYGQHPIEDGTYTVSSEEMTSNGTSSGTPLANASSMTTPSQFTDYWHNYS
ncbi:MAG: hypothetical protein K6T83_20145 [Alicyclobacillus sp.]|nr:hypothetical protein [Alicyclobacillus sp.]